MVHDFLVLAFLAAIAVNCVAENKTCTWYGTAPFCGSDQEDCFDTGTEFIKQDNAGDGNSCWTGSKTLCCKNAGLAPCNGMAEMCYLKFNHVTFPGTHNSGAGYSGALKYGIGIDAISCFYQNQGLSFTNQLNFGIRYFDIDLCWFKERLYTCHENAYAGTLSDVFSQISDWMNKQENRAQVIVILIDDVDFGKERFPDLVQELEKAFPGTVNKTGLNNYLMNTFTWPTLGKAVETNRRVFFFLGDKVCDMKCRINHTYIHTRFMIGDTWKSIGISFDCDELAEVTKKKCEERVFVPLLTISHFASYGLCLWDLARKCDTSLRKNVETCESVRGMANQTVNFITVDYPEKAPIRQLVTDVAMELNKRNVKRFLKNNNF